MVFWWRLVYLAVGCFLVAARLLPVCCFPPSCSGAAALVFTPAPLGRYQIPDLKLTFRIQKIHIPDSGFKIKPHRCRHEFVPTSSEIHRDQPSFGLRIELCLSHTAAL